MSKNPNRNSKSVKRDEPMNGAMKLFLAGCVAELYLLVIRRFYVSGTIYQLLACHTALLYVMIAGVVVLAAGLILALAARKQPKKSRLGWAIFAAGVFLALSALLVRTLGGSALTVLCVVVPAAMLIFGRPTEQQRTREKPRRFAPEAVVCENTYRDRSEAELRADFAARDAGPGYDFDRDLQAFCARKYDSEFSREMSRSAAVYLADFLPGAPAEPARQKPQVGTGRCIWPLPLGGIVW